MREAQRARGEKTLLRRPLAPGAGQGAAAGARRRARRWSASATRPTATSPGTTWSRARSRITNHEIDDLIIVRADGVPTYNFAVVVDDWDMRDHATSSAATSTSTTRRGRSTSSTRSARRCRVFGHVPIILGDDGQKLSKRRGAVSVTAYEEAGYLPEAMLNYLARLGWSHGDEELFSREQLVAVVRRQPPVEEPGAVGPGQARLGQCALPQGAGRRRAGWRWSRRSWRGAASPPPTTSAAARRLRAVQGPLQHRRSSWPTGWRCSSCRRRAERRRPGARTSTDAVRPALRDPAPTGSTRSTWDKAGDRRGDQGDAGRARAEDAAAGAGGARAGLRPGADAVARRGARAVPARDGARRACGRPDRRLAIIFGLAFERIAFRRGYSSAGRALAWHARGQRFDPAYLHQGTSSRAVKRHEEFQSPSSRGLGHHPFTVITGVRIP